MSETRATRMWHKCNASETRTTRVWHSRYTSDTSATRVKNFNFDNDTGKNIFSHPYIYYMVSKRLQGEEQFHTTNYLLEMSCFHAKMCLKSEPQKLTLMAKAISKSCKLDWAANALARSHLVMQSKAASFSIKTMLCQNTNILLSMNYWKLGKNEC